MKDPSQELRETIETLVAELRDEGCLDSSGRFTLDPSRAQHQFRRFLTSDYTHYCLWLAAAAVALGAHHFQLTRGLEHLCVVCQGWNSPPDELQQLLQEEAPLREDHIGHLSFALNALLSANPREVVLESNHQRLVATPGEIRLAPLRRPQPGLLRLAVSFSEPDFQPGEVPEKALLLRRIPRQLIEVEVNRSSNVPLVLWDEFHGSHYWPGIVDLRPLAEPGPRVVHPPDGEVSVLLAVDSWHRGQQAELLFLHQGVLIPLEVAAPLPYRALVAWSDLKLDLGRSRIVQDRPLHRLIEQLHEKAEIAAEDFVSHYPDLAPEARDRAGNWLEYLLHRFEHRGRKQQAALCRDWLQTHHPTGVRWLTCHDAQQLLRDSMAAVSQAMPARLPASSQPARPGSFWHWLSRLGSFGAPAPTPPLAPAETPHKRWKRLLGILTRSFEARSGLRLGLSGAGPDPDWLQLEGLLTDGCSLLITARERTVQLRLHAPSFWDVKSLPSQLEPPPNWVVDLQCGPPWIARFTSSTQDWKDPEQLASILERLHQARQRAQSVEQLACPACRVTMEKWVLDVVLDRCPGCQALWLDHHELEWLIAQNPGMTWEVPEGCGPCPRCRSQLVMRSRAKRDTWECERCRGTWLRPSFPRQAWARD